MNDAVLTTAVLQLLRLKGRAAPGSLAASLGQSAGRIAALLADLGAQGQVLAAGANFRLSPAGREQLAQRIAAERGTLDGTALAQAYHDFHDFNTGFKTIVTDWQIRDGVANDHADAAYDAAIVARLADLHARWQPLLARIVALVPRAAPYPERFARALEGLAAGDGSWFARPIADSYHTVWFELHEDLIGWLGRSREAEAAAGRAE